MGKNESNKLYLRAFELEDEGFLIKLRRTKDLFRYTCGNTYFMSSEHSKKMLNENLISNKNHLYLVICLSENDLPIGYLNVAEIDHVNKRIEWGGIVIDPQFSNKGYATMAAHLLLTFIFEELNMNRVYGSWLEENVSSLKMSKKLGFQTEGILKEHVYKNNSYHNVIVCSMLKKDYYASKSIA